MPNDPFNPNDLTDEERNAKALARADLEMLSGLVRLRHKRGLTQEDVARAIGRNKSAVSRFERLDSDPRLSTVRRYARAVGAIVEHRVAEFRADRIGRPMDLPLNWPESALVIVGAQLNLPRLSQVTRRSSAAWEEISTAAEEESFAWAPGKVTHEPA